MKPPGTTESFVCLPTTRGARLSLRFGTDDRPIFAEIMDEAGKAKLLDRLKSQFAFARVMRVCFYAAIEFSDGHMPVRWWPHGRGTPVVIDAACSFGQGNRHHCGHSNNRAAGCGADSRPICRELRGRPVFALMIPGTPASVCFFEILGVLGGALIDIRDWHSSVIERVPVVLVQWQDTAA